MQRVCRYKTEDGREFETMEEAKSHEIFLDTQTALHAELLSAVKSGRVEAVIHLMIDHASQVRDILNKHLRRQPREVVVNEQ